MSKIGPYNLSSTFLRLAEQGGVEPLAVDDRFWEKLASGRFGTFHNEYLVTCHNFEADWQTWEMHPKGDEVVCLLSGSVTFILEQEEGNRAFELSEGGAYVIVPRGTWHTAKANGPCRMLFITPGEDTQHREVVE